jgi:hypothetical protein
VDFRAGRDLYLAVIALRYLYTTLSRQNGRTNCTTSIKLNNLLPCAGSQRKRPNRVRVCDSKYVLPIQGPMELSSGIAPAATGRDETNFLEASFWPDLASKSPTKSGSDGARWINRCEKPRRFGMLVDEEEFSRGRTTGRGRKISRG